MCGRIELDEGQNLLIEEGVIDHSGTLSAPHPSNRVTRLCGNKTERAFVARPWSFTSPTKVVQIGELMPKATRDQIRQIIEDRHGIKLDNRQYERLMSKYISREGRSASRFELAAQTRQGRQGVPSEYQLTGLLQIMRKVGSTNLAIAA